MIISQPHCFSVSVTFCTQSYKHDSNMRVTLLLACYLSMNIYSCLGKFNIQKWTPDTDVNMRWQKHQLWSILRCGCQGRQTVITWWNLKTEFSIFARLFHLRFNIFWTMGQSHLSPETSILHPYNTTNIISYRFDIWNRGHIGQDQEILQNVKLVMLLPGFNGVPL
uniref:Uncharacterized protein n=1 Tax=Opuntia streptacantha TaxID=393608 RepID=A0A7C9ESW9_OPUST